MSVAFYITSIFIFSVINICLTIAILNSITYDNYHRLTKFIVLTLLFPGGYIYLFFDLFVEVIYNIYIKYRDCEFTFKKMFNKLDSKIKEKF